MDQDEVLTIAIHDYFIVFEKTYVQMTFREITDIGMMCLQHSQEVWILINNVIGNSPDLTSATTLLSFVYLVIYYRLLGLVLLRTRRLDGSVCYI